MTAYDELRQWATKVSTFMAEDKSNDWSEEIAELEEIEDASGSGPIVPGARVEHVGNPNLDYRTVIAVGPDWVWLDFQQAELDAGRAPTRLPIENYRRIA